MGLFLCNVCDKEVNTKGEHICSKEDIIQHIDFWKNLAYKNQIYLDKIQNAVYNIFQSLPSLDASAVLVETNWLRQLYKAADCQWYKEKSADNFLVRWLVTHSVLCEAFDLFRSKKKETKLEKLQNLRKACKEVADTLDYNDANLDILPEQLV